MRILINILIWIAKLRPYTHIKSADGKDTYMWRYWLFNPYKFGTSGKGSRFPFSIRLHHICRPDNDRHLHDHPWDARTFILRGWYVEERANGERLARVAGDTFTLNHNDYHKILDISQGGVWTLFVTFKYRGDWGFLVDGVKVPHLDYINGSYCKDGECRYAVDVGMPYSRCKPGTCCHVGVYQ